MEKEIKLNPEDLYKISLNLISKLILKDGTIIILDDSVPKSMSSNLFISSKKDKNILLNSIFEPDLKENNSDNKKYFLNDSNLRKFNTLKIEDNKTMDIIDKKIKAKLGEKKGTRNKQISIINTEININIKPENEKNGSSHLIRDFDELLLNFNDKKKVLSNQISFGKERNKYKYYKKSNLKKDILFNEMSYFQNNTKAIKYITSNISKNNFNHIIEMHKCNKFKNANQSQKLKLIKGQKMKKNKSNSIFRNERKKNFNDIISPPNNLKYNFISFS